MNKLVIISFRFLFTIAWPIIIIDGLIQFAGKRTIDPDGFLLVGLILLVLRHLVLSSGAGSRMIDWQFYHWEFVYPVLREEILRKKKSGMIPLNALFGNSLGEKRRALILIKIKQFLIIILILGFILFFYSNSSHTGLTIMCLAGLLYSLSFFIHHPKNIEPDWSRVFPELSIAKDRIKEIDSDPANAIVTAKELDWNIFICKLHDMLIRINKKGKLNKC